MTNPLVNNDEVEGAMQTSRAPGACCPDCSVYNGKCLAMHEYIVAEAKKSAYDLGFEMGRSSIICPVCKTNRASEGIFVCAPCAKIRGAKRMKEATRS